MTAPLDPQMIQELAAGYVLGDLSSEEAEMFHRLLAEDPTLQAEVDDLQASLAMMPYGLPEQQPKSALRSRILTAAQADLAPTADPAAALTPPSVVTPSVSPFSVACGAAAQHSPQRSMQWWSRRWLSKPWVVALLAVLGIASAYGAGQLSQRNRPMLASEPEAGSMQAFNASRIDDVWIGFPQLVADHQKSLGNPNGPADMAMEQAVELTHLSDFSTTVTALPVLPSRKYKLIGGSDCEFGKTQGVRLSYELSAVANPAKIVSAYQLDLNGDQFPLFQASHITLQQPDGTNLVLWRDDSYLYALVAALPAEELYTLAQTMDRT